MEYPEIHVITIPAQDQQIRTNHAKTSASWSYNKGPVTPAKRRFIVAVFKVVAELTAQRDRKIREKEQEKREKSLSKQNKNTTGLPSLTRAEPKTSRAQSPNKLQKNRIPAPLCPDTAIRRSGDPIDNRVPEELPDVASKGSETPFARRIGGMHLSSIVRLERFRKMMARRLNSLQSAEDSDTDDDCDEEIPRKPRFSATLSPEAQYAMMKGYEDILVDYLLPTQHRTKLVLYRVKTPHQKVVSLKVAEEDRTQERRGDRRQFLSPSDARSHLSSQQKTPRHRTRSASGVASFPDGRRHRTSNVSYAEPEALKDKQIRMTCCFQKAMAIVDTIRTSQGLMVTSPRDRKLFRNPVKVYNRWSQVWSKEFKFQYA